MKSLKTPPRKNRTFIVLALIFLIAVGVEPSVGQTCPSPSFSNPPIYAIGTNTDVRSMTSADFDGDGRPDIAVADDNSSTVTVLMKVAQKVPAELHTYTVGTNPTSIAAGDFNGDGKQDIATANNTTYDVTLLLNDGTGAFVSGGSFFVGSGTQAIAAGDFNGDGRSDVAVGTGPSGKTVVMLGKSQGGFGAPINLAPAARFIVTGDINNDGKLDLAMITSSVEILLGDGTGHFPIASCGAGPASRLALGDVDGDGKLDLVAAFILQSQIQVMRGNGTGCFESPSSYDGRYSDIKLGDLNNDGRPELIAGTTVMLNNGSGGFGNAIGYGTGSPGAEAGTNTTSIKDFNLDGNLDVATVGRDSVSILLGNGHGGFKFSTGSYGIQGLARADLNGDGNADLALLANKGITIMLGDGLGGFSSNTTVQSFSTFVGPVVADFNRDGKLDVAALETSRSGPGGRPRVIVFAGDGVGGLGGPILTSVADDSPLDLAASDFNGDGNIDLAEVNRTGGLGDHGTEGSLTVLLGDGTGHFAPLANVSVSTTVNPSHIGLADFNSDGKTDIAIPGVGTVLLGNGAGGFVVSTVFSGVPATSIAVADLNGDNKPDVAMAGSSQLSVALGNGAGGFDPPSQFPAGSFAWDLAVADFNGDGRIDIAVVNGRESPTSLLASVSVFFGDGFGSFALASPFTVEPEAKWIVTGDFNGDRRPDIVSTSDIGNLTLLLNTCTGPVAPPPVVEFSAPNFSRGEGEGNALVTVTRTGDTARGSEVSYATSDSSGGNNCNVNNGIASSRCDYLTTIGTLKFAANETLKTISIPIVDDAYAEGLGESFGISLSNPSGATLGGTSSAAITITDNDASNGANSIDASSFFVRQNYVDFLNREPDMSGLNFWSDQIEGCTPKPDCTEIKRINVSGAFFLSIEFQETGYLVERIYKTAYGDATGTSNFGPTHQLPVPIIRLNEFLPDTQRIGQGVVVGVGDWQTQLENNKVAFTQEFVLRERFFTANPRGTPAEYVDRLSTNAGVTPAAAERQSIIDEFGGAATSGDLNARARALRRVAENSTLNQMETNKAFVLMQYFGYLRRNPNDTPDADYTGYDFWLGKLNQFNGNFVNAEMVKAFLVSNEYRQRFGP